MVKLALLWHMHQPYYEDLATGEHILPWVRLHAIKDYWGMVAMLEAFPRIRLTFNLVPSLVRQVQAFAEDRARDRHLAMGLKPASELTPDEARWMVANGFHAPYGRMIGPYPRYAQLHAARMERRPFTVDELRDLQVWHKLAWMDPDRLAADPRLLALVARDRDYTEDDKVLLRSIELELLSLVVPAYRAAGARGQIELATSPYYHPILPLLCDSDAHQHAHPGAARPRHRFTRPGDARLQIERALDFHESAFGIRPSGMWPSEGSVSDEAVALMAAAGVSWIATDEDILSRSLKMPLGDRSDLLYRPYRISETGPVVLFRDHALSDRIGFAYQSWDPAAAAADFVERVREAGRRYSAATGGEVATVPVILDGENAWEHFDGGGRPFLRALYSALEAAGDIRTVTMSEAASGPAQPLASIFPGSWINGDFYIWMGHRDDHRAWDQLSAARDVLDRQSASVPAEARDRALEELLIAEGSDWFWWYGDDHSSDHDAEFDDLFRRHLRNAYAALGVPVPEELFATNISSGTGPDRLEPAGVMTLALDGRDTSFLEWVGAVPAPLSKPGGAMHEVAASSFVAEVRVGFSASGLCLRLAGAGLATLVASGSASVVLVVAGAAVRVLRIERGWIASASTIEIQVPFDRIGISAGTDLVFAVQVRDASDAILESVPHGGHWTIGVPKIGSSGADWQA
jgi:alpha-amylase/alpha-mannosidase (GH57 family)